LTSQVDKILNAVDDEDLAELELPRQLQKLQRVSKTCILDAKDIKEKVEMWKTYVQNIRKACEDEKRVLFGPPDCDSVC
jgi:hypothetical protein